MWKDWSTKKYVENFFAVGVFPMWNRHFSVEKTSPNLHKMFEKVVCVSEWPSGRNPCCRRSRSRAAHCRAAARAASGWGFGEVRGELRWGVTGEVRWEVTGEVRWKVRWGERWGERWGAPRGVGEGGAALLADVWAQGWLPVVVQVRGKVLSHHLRCRCRCRCRCWKGAGAGT